MRGSGLSVERVRELTGATKGTILKCAKNHDESRAPLPEESLMCVSRRGESGRKRKTMGEQDYLVGAGP